MMPTCFSTNPSRLLVSVVVIHAFLGTGCSASRAQAAPAAAPAAMVAEDAAPAPAAARAGAAENGYSDVNTDKSLNTSSYVRAWAEDLLETASRFRRELYRLDGYVLAERVDYEDGLRVRKHKLPRRAPRNERGQAVFQVNVPIEHLPELLDWLRIESIIVEQYVVATRDGALAAPTVVATQKNQQEQLAQRLTELEQRIAQASEEERPALEAERDALRQALEQSQAVTAVPEIRLATLDVRFEADRPQVRFAAAKLVPNVRASLFVTDLLDQNDGQDNGREARVGAAVGVGIPSFGRGGLVPAPLVELAGYPSTADRGAGMSVTLGSAMYARSLGDGERRSLNPFAGFRLGYAYWGEHAFVVAGEIGVELLKTSGIAWSVSVRPQGLIGKDSQVGLESGSSLSLAF